ncbi:MAG: hypothetical protein KKE61_03130 [Proteobacteria bacterium]|nr:hypothetical protein [Pseudomonadota bacterium]
MENISPIHQFEGMLPRNRVFPPVNRKRKRKKELAANPGRCFSALSRLVDDTHLGLIEQESPFRLCVYRKKGETFMDIVTLDKAKKINQLYNRAITNKNMGNMVQRIHRGMGLILDYSA